MLRYFLGNEVMQSKHNNFLSQRKYVLDLLSEIGKLGVKPCNSLSIHLTREGKTFEGPERYRRLVRKLNYLIVTCRYIAHSISVVSKYISFPTVNHWAIVEHILCYLKEALGRGILYNNHGHNKIGCFSNVDWTGFKEDRSTSGYCVFVGGNLVSFKSKN